MNFQNIFDGGRFFHGVLVFEGAVLVGENFDDFSEGGVLFTEREFGGYLSIIIDVRYWNYR